MTGLSSAVGGLTPVPLAVEGGGFHVPSLEELFEYPAFWWSEDWAIGNIPLGFNRTSMLVFIGVVVVSLFAWAAVRNASVVPGKVQGIFEAIVRFIREEIVIQVIGPDGLKFLPFLTTLFLFIFMNNLYEIIPFVNFPTTGRMALPAFLAFVTWAVYLLAGMKEQGPLAYFKNAAIPPGVPAFVLPLVIPIELAQILIIRPLTLAIRLFANMMAGHILLAILFIAGNAFLFDVHDMSFNLKGSPVGLVALAAGPAMVGFELMVGALQAYIFTILAAVYLGGSLHPEH